MKTKQEIDDRLEGCKLELDGHLHPHGGINEYQAAVLQGWVFALSWALEKDELYTRSEEIRELIK